MTQNTTSRRAVTTGLAWSVPAVAVAAAAPSFAASVNCITTQKVVWGDGRLVTSSSKLATYTTADPDGSGPLKPLTVTIANTYTGTNTQLRAQFTDQYGRVVTDNLKVTSGTIGGGTNPLTLHQSPISNTSKTNTRTDANKTETTFTFSQPVTNLSFTITDIDSANNDFADAVAITSTAPFTGTPSTPTYMTGTGTLTDPWRARSNDASVANTASTANVKVDFTGTLTSFKLTYWNIASSYDNRVDGDQKIFLSDFTVTYDACV